MLPIANDRALSLWMSNGKRLNMSESHARTRVVFTDVAKNKPDRVIRHDDPRITYIERPFLSVI
jgi:hypothetical protein